MKSYASKRHDVFAQHWQTGEDLQVIVGWLNEREIPWHAHLPSEMGSDTIDDTEPEWLNERERATSICFDFADHEFDKGHWLVARPSGVGATGEVLYDFKALTDEQFRDDYVVPKE